MTFEQTQAFLGWCSVINAGILMLWFVGLIACRPMIYRIHGKLFKISEDRFDAIHYAGMAYYKIAVIVFNIVPYVAMRILA